MKMLALLNLLPRRIALPLLLGFATCAVTGSALAQGNLLFSGGNGTPLKITLTQPVTYLITTGVNSSGVPTFVFENVSPTFTVDGVAGNITFQINSGGTLTLNTAVLGATLNNTSPTDLGIFGNANALAVGDIVRLNAGTLTTANNFAGATPRSGAYTTYVDDGNTNTRLSQNGVSVAPEPSTWAMLLGGAGLLGVVARRRAARA